MFSGVTLGLVALLVVLLVAVGEAGAQAVQTPFTKLGVYKKVLSVVSSSGAALEFGNNGQDIAATGNIVFRPGASGVVATDGLQVVRNGALSDLYVSGDLCLYDHANSMAQTCRHQWPTSSGSTLWESGSAADEWGTGYNFIKPKDVAGATPSVRLTQPISLVGEAYYNDTILAKNLNNAGLAAQFSGDVISSGSVNVFNQLRVNNREVWHTYGGYTRYALPGTCDEYSTNPGALCTTDDDCTGGGYCQVSSYNFTNNEGIESRLPGENFGLDADRLKGNQATIEPASSCVDNTDFNPSVSSKPHIACLCFYPQFYFLAESGFDEKDPSPVTKRCLPLANYY